MAVLFRTGLLHLEVIFILLESFASGSSVKKFGPKGRAIDFKLNITIPGRQPAMDEEYVCISWKVSRKGYAIGFNPIARSDRVHHMLLFSCSEPGREGSVWDCLASPVCNSPPNILYAWARNAPPLTLPEDVGSPIGFENSEYLVLQVHYALMFEGNVWDYSGVSLNMVSQQPSFLSAVLLFATNGPTVPPHTETHFMNMSCRYNGVVDVHPFAFRTHTHTLGRVVSAAAKSNGKWILIGKRNPQWPQVFQYITNPPVIHPGDILAAQCRYNSTELHHQVHVGAHGDNEMCNFYMMYYYDVKVDNPFKDSFAQCSGMSDSSVFDSYPKEASSLLPYNADLEEEAHQSTVNFGVVEKWKWTRAGNINFGQISGLSFDTNGNLVVLHRGEFVWGSRSIFDAQNKLIDRKAISVDTVLTIDSKSGGVISSWGANRFYIPHGVTVDSKGNVWLTDVGLHQVLKYVSDGKHMKEEGVWGERFVPGQGSGHFCKPTAVAVLSDGSFFVADGYCNNRVVHFGADGKFAKEIGKRTGGGELPLGTFILPHDIGLHEEMNHIHVADRENGRLQCLFFNGTPAFDIRLPGNFYTVYSVDYNVKTNTFFMMPGEKPKKTPGVIKAFSVSPTTRLPLYSWAPKSGNFLQPHIIRVSKDGSHVFVGEISGGGGVLWKFQIKQETKELEMKQHPETGDQGSVELNKPNESTDELLEETRKKSSLFLVVVVVVVTPALLIALVCACLRFKKQGGFRTTNMLSQSSFRKGKFGSSGLNGAFRSHKGFQPLRTEDIDAVDDLTEDESDNEDTLFAVPQRRTVPLTA